MSSVEVYSAETNQFSFVHQMSLARSFFGCRIIGNNIYVLGGYLKRNHATDSVEVYDIKNDIWSSDLKLPLPLALFGHSIAC